MMKSSFGRTFRIVFCVHLGVLCVLMLLPCFYRWFRPKKLATIPIGVVLHEEAPTQKKVEKDPAPRQKEEKKKKRKTEISDKIVKRRKTREESKTVSADEVKRRLLSGDEKSKISTSSQDEDAIYFDIVRRAMYRAWIQPESLAVEGLTTKAMIQLANDGTVISGKVIRPSGNGVMDASVKSALASVKRIPGLSASFLATHREITVDFELSGPDALR